MLLLLFCQTGTVYISKLSINIILPAAGGGTSSGHPKPHTSAWQHEPSSGIEDSPGGMKMSFNALSAKHCSARTGVLL